MSKFEDVSIEGAKLLLMLSGQSGSGKTYSGLQLGVGLAGGDMSKVAFIDTENGRGKLYSSSFPKPYKYASLEAPFSPQRFIEIIDDCEKQLAKNCEVLIIDSMSHEWDQIGGCLEIAEQKNWMVAKKEHRKLMQRLLTCKYHVILCFRAKEMVKIETEIQGFKKKQKYISLGIQPITERDVKYEGTVSLLITNEGRRQTPLKSIPSELLPILGRGEGYLTQADGEALKNWVNGGGVVNKDFLEAEQLLRKASQGGTQALKETWLTLETRVRKMFGDSCPDVIKRDALSVDNVKAGNVLEKEIVHEAQNINNVLEKEATNEQSE